VLAVKVSEELNLICSGDGNGQIILWSLYTGVLLGEVDAHSASVLSISLDKRDLVSTSKDRTVKLWQILGDGLEQTALRHQYVLPCCNVYARSHGNPLLRYTLEGHEWPILASKIYGHRVITTSKDSVRIWSIEDGSCLEVIQTFSSICEFDMVPGCEGLQAMCACTDGQVRIYDLADGKEVACLQGHAGVVRDVKVLTCPLMPGYMIISAGYDGTLRVWATEPKKEQWQCIHILSFSDRLVTWFGEETEATEVKGEDIKPRAKRVFSMWLDGTTAYVVGEGAEIVVFNLGGLEAIRYFLEQ
jgi:F-box and WD-40 domain protein 1/11